MTYRPSMAGPVNFKHSCILCKTLEVFWHVTLIKNNYYYYYYYFIHLFIVCAHLQQKKFNQYPLWDVKFRVHSCLIWGSVKNKTKQIRTGNLSVVGPGNALGTRCWKLGPLEHINTSGGKLILVFNRFFDYSYVYASLFFPWGSLQKKKGKSWSFGPTGGPPPPSPEVGPP